jgi:hypothetical protein
MVFSKDIFSAIYVEYIKGFVPIRYRGYCLCISPHLILIYLQARVSQQQRFTMTKDSGIDKGKESITPPAPKKSLDRASNRLARTIAQILTGHWLCAPYLKRVRKNRDEQVSDKCWWCGQYRMSRAHAFLRCIHPNLEGARNKFGTA